MVHIKYLNEYNLESLRQPDPKDVSAKPAKPGLYSSLCMAEKSEQEAYDEATRSSGPVHANDDPNDIEPCNDRHKDCLMWSSCGSYSEWTETLAGNFQEGRLTFEKDLSVLAVCRLLYEESNNILWQTNTFSFDDAISFRRFNASMTPSQKRKLKKLHIHMNVTIDQPANTYSWYRNAWEKAIVPRVLTPFHNLKVLHLSFNQHCSTVNTLHTVTPVSHEKTELCMKYDMETLLGLRLLPWKDMNNKAQGKHVTVVVSDDPSTHFEIVTPRWTKDQKLNIAERLRSRLAAPDSAKIHEAEATAKEAAKQLRYKKMRRATIRSLQALVEDLKTRVDAAKERADARQARAGGSTTGQGRGGKKGQLTADKLKKISDSRLGAAKRAETTHNNLYESLVNSQAELASMLADPNYTPRKHVAWMTVDDYLSD